MPSNKGSHPFKATVCAKFKLRLLDQVNGKHRERERKYAFYPSNANTTILFLTSKNIFMSLQIYIYIYIYLWENPILSGTVF